MVKGRHTIAFGGLLDRTQLNIVNNTTSADTLDFRTFLTFVQGNVRGGDAFQGSANRYYRSKTAGLYVNDNFKMRSNLTVTAGLRWDYDGPLTKNYGKLTGFNPTLYSYALVSDSITNSGLEIATNNPTAGTKDAGNSLMQQHQWGFAPRIGVAWTPMSKLTVRAGFGMYCDRGELFSYLSPSAGAGFNGPFGGTLAPPFVQSIAAHSEANSLSAPFGTVEPTPLPVTQAGFLSYLPNLSQTACSFPVCWPTGNLFGPFLYGGYDINNRLPFTENWTLDFQYQATNNWLFEVGYVGNHGNHEGLPIPFNQAMIATEQNPMWAQNPANEQIYSYGGATPLELNSEPVFTNGFSGNAPVRVPYIGYDMNSVSYQAEGISNFDALQIQVRKRLSQGLQFTAAYTYSHALDEQSGFGLFFFEADAFNIFNQADFDTPNNNVVFFPDFSGPPSIPPEGSLGVIQHTIGSSRFLQLSLHLDF